MMNDTKLIICFYSDPDARKLRGHIAAGMEVATSIFDGFGIEMGNCSCACRKRAKGLTDHRLYTCTRTISRILEENDKGNLLYLNIANIPKRRDAEACFDWLLEFEVGVFDDEGPTCCQVGIDWSLLERRRQDAMDIVMSVSRQISDLISAKYGFVTSMPRSFLPSGYFMGIAGGVPDKLVWDANSWRGGAHKNYATQIRNVHSMNFVNSRHLRQRVGSQTLKDWIAADSKRGEIETWNTRLSLWSFLSDSKWPKSTLWDNRKLASARKQLEQHQLFPWQEFIAQYQ